MSGSAPLALYHELGKLAIKYGGSISGEHGIGYLKRELLKEEFMSKSSLEAYEIMKKIKELFDPKGIMNPGKVF